MSFGKAGVTHEDITTFDTGDQNFTRSGNYTWYDTFSDNDFSTVDTNKEITLSPTQVNITQENNSQVIPFEIRQGSKDCTGGVSYAVTVLQRHLGLKVDGIFGAGTKAKLVEWQKAHGLAADGICGMATWSSF